MQVLTPVVLAKALANLISHLLHCLLQLVLNREDIAASDAEHMANLLSRTLTQMEALITVAISLVFLLVVKRATRSSLPGGCPLASAALLRDRLLPYPRDDLLPSRLSPSPSPSPLSPLSMLQEIGDRWCGGAGPLARYIGVGDLKQLVRALFQNTTARASLLAMIN
jgi:hypothetical protein